MSCEAFSLYRQAGRTSVLELRLASDDRHEDAQGRRIFSGDYPRLTIGDVVE
jgi:hypothetical protein